MMGEKSMERQFFSVVYEIASCKHLNPFISHFILLAYLLQLVLCYFVVVDANSIISTTLLSAPFLPLIITCLSGLFLAELGVAFIYKVQTLLRLQLMLHRYILFPMGLFLLVAEIQKPRFLSPQIAISLLLLLTAITYFINFIIHSYSQCSIGRTFEKASNFLILTDCLLVLVKLPSSFIYIETIVVLQLLFHLLTRYWLQRYTFASSLEQIEYYSMLLKDFLMTIFASQKALIIGGNAIFMLGFISPLLLLIAVHEFTRKRRVMINSLVFSGQAPIKDFLELLETMNVELGRFKSNQDLELHGSLLLVFVALHRGRCSNSTCLLLQRSTEEEIRNCNSSNNMKILKHKIVKKIESLFELYERTHNGKDHTQLKLHLVAFYLHHLPNKLKIAHLVSAIRTLELSWDERLVFFGLRRRIEEIEVVEELMEASKGEDEFVEFKKLMSSAVGCFQEFWSELLEERVDMNQLAAASSRLFPLKKTIERIWRTHLNREKFTSWNILRTYTYYRRNILHDYTNSVILEDYCKIVEERLKAKHEMSYINSETEQAVLAISLTESSLGNIASMNNQTCKLFSFASKDEMMELRVNDIMPSVYSVVHDNILSSFLKNRFKNINQDLRFVFGKNKNGFIFPFLLQLRKLSWNLNDELIFIAHLEPAKLRSAPIYCITDLEGDLQDFTSTFAWLFMKKGKENLEIKRKNIQEMIPSFFEGMDSGASQGKVKFHERTYSHKNGHNIEIQFSACELYIKNEKVGYLVEGTNTQMLQTLRDQKNISTLLANFYLENNIYTNSYSPATLAYQIPNQRQFTDKNMSKEFTIPFLKTTDIEGILKFNQEKPQYDLNIKTLRLLHGRLEHVVEEESFHSDEDNFEMKELSLIKKIEKMKEDLSVEEENNFGDYFRKIVAAITLLFVLLLLSIVAQTTAFEQAENYKYKDIQYKLHIRQLLPQFLIYSLYQPQLLRPAIRDQLKSNIINSTIDEGQKEDLFKAIFQSPISNAPEIDQILLTFNYELDETYSTLMSLWYLSAATAFLYLLTLLVIYFIFKFKIYNIYLVFLSIGESKLQDMQDKAARLLEFLSVQSIEYNKIAPLQDFKRDDSEEAEFQRMKKLKNDYTKDDMASLAQLGLPALLIVAYSIFCCIFIQSNFSNYQSFVNAWFECSEMLPETSVTIFNTLIKKNHFMNVTLDTHFSEIEGEFEYVVNSGVLASTAPLLHYMQEDPCRDPALFSFLNINISNFCTNTSTFLEFSLANVLNYMSTVLEASNSSSSIDWPFLILLQFHFVKPLLNYITDQLGNSLISLRQQCEQYVIVFSIIFISLLLMAATYIICYPLFDIYERILFTTDLIKILPSDRESEPEQALAAMTTEAMENY